MIEKLTMKQYAAMALNKDGTKGISRVAAQKRIKNRKRWPEIKRVQKITDRFFIIHVDATLLQK